MAAREGFTLIELIACLLIVAVATAVVTLNFRGRQTAASMEELIDQLRMFHLDTVERARRHGRPLQVLIDLRQGLLVRLDASSQEAIGTALRVPVDRSEQGSGGPVIHAVETLDARWTEGAFTVPYNREGRCPTWWVELHTPGDGQGSGSDSGGISGGVVIAGGSGQVEVLDDAEAMEQLRSAWSAARDDAR